MVNQIGKITFNFNMQNETFARELYARWDSFFALNFERIADEVLAKYDKAGQVVEIEKLELDLGIFSENDFDEQFPLRVRGKLEEAVIQWKVESGEWRIESENPSFSTLHSQLSTQRNFQLLTEFLLHGTLPWNTPTEYKNIPHLFTVVLQQEGAKLKQFLQTYGHYTSLQERLVYQLNDPELEKGVQLLQPSNAAFICSYVHLLHAKYATIERPGLEEPAYRNTVWLVVYAYLLNNRSSYFDKKTFLAQTILRLAAKNNLSYERLLEMITRELEHFSERVTIPVELFKLLSELRKELSEQQFQRSAFSAAKFYQTIAGLLQKEIRQGINESTRESLLLILSRAGSCRAFLQQLTEPEIIGLVPIVVPNKSDSDFVIETAKSIENGELRIESDKWRVESGELRVKNNTLHSPFSTFNLVKWQFIFPLLLSNRGATLNREYFVENLLKQIAAHYNLEYSDLLAYVYQSRNLFDKPLQIILQELSELGTRNEKGIISNKELVVSNKKNIPNYSFLITHLEKNSSLLTANYYHKLVREYFPSDSEFIIAYANQLDIAHEKGFLEGKTSGEFRQLKWRFILTALSQMPSSTFSKRYLVEQTLQKIAAHYNLSYFDLLAYFHTEEAAYYLPFELQTVLNELFYDEKEYWINIILHSNNETDKFKLVKTLFPAEQAFVKTYVQALDYCHEKGFLQGKTSGNFRQIKWKFIFEVLFELQKVAFNKKQFIERTLDKLAAHYNLTILDLLSWFYADAGFVSAFPNKEITKIFNELYNAQKAGKSTSGKTNIAIIKKYLLQYPASKNEQLLFEKLSQQTTFITYTLEIISLLPKLRKFLKTNFQVSINNEKILQLLLEISSNYHSLSRAEILKRLLKIILMSNEKLGIRNEENLLNYPLLTTNSKEWGKIVAKNKELPSLIQESKKTIIKNEKTIMKQEEKNLQNENWNINEISNEGLEASNEQFVMSNENSEENSSFIENAGIVLLAPYFPRLFEMLKLTENRQFKNRDAQIRAIFLLQYAAFDKIEFPEHELILSKLLTGFETGQPLPKNVELTPNEKETVESLLKGALQNWPKLKNTSIPWKIRFKMTPLCQSKLIPFCQ